MRYWIYWNDLVQGPFEVQELASLRAFTADLSVCEEYSQDWVPAAAVPELLPYFQPVLTAEEPVPIAPPPPAAPTRPPTLSPLQGEFFSEPAGQQPLFDLNGSRNYVFKPIEDAAAAPEVSPPWRTPFFFRVYTPPVIEPTPTPSPAEEVEFSPPPAPIIAPEREVPVFEEWGSGAVEPEEMHLSEPPPPIVEAPRPLVMEEPFVPIAEEEVVEVPRIADQVTAQEDVIEEIIIEPSPAPAPVPAEPPVRVFRAPRVAIPDFETAHRPTVEEPHTRLWPWVVGVWLGLGLIGFGFYHFMGHAPKKVETPEPVVLPPAPVIAEPVKVVKPKPIVKVRVKKAPKPKPVEPVVEEKPPVEKPLVLPGIAPVPEPDPAPPPPSPAASASDVWRGKELAAIDLVLRHKIYAGKRTVGDNAKMILDEQHDKELLHAGEMGERLYLPDKISWMALREEGARYRVYLNFQAMQANGERVLAGSHQFIVNLQKKTVEPADDTTRHDHFDPAAMRVYQHSAKADEIQTLLNGVDVVNKHRLQAVILKSSKQKDGKKKIEADLKAAEDKLQKEIVYFRTKYAEKTLQNVGKAYNFMAVLKGK